MRCASLKKRTVRTRTRGMKNPLACVRRLINHVVLSRASFCRRASSRSVAARGHSGRAVLGRLRQGVEGVGVDPEDWQNGFGKCSLFTHTRIGVFQQNLKLLRKALEKKSGARSGVRGTGTSWEKECVVKIFEVFFLCDGES